ncbi:MAG: site-specific integrase [Armatimonadetes bacterium]|nr:site-specific integrase [Armatimonadota bacterium]
MRGCIYKRSKNSWTVVVELPRDPVTNKRRQKSITVKGTKKDAERELARLINEIETGMYVEPSQMTLGDYLDQWLLLKKGKVKETTWYEYSSRVNRLKSLEIAKKPLQKITALDVEMALQKLSGVEQSRKKGLYITLKNAFKKAVSLKILTYNPVSDVDSPKAEEKEMHVWTKEEAARFLKAIEKHKYHALCYLALKTGARLGELLALHWEDIDFEGKKIHITKTLAVLPGEIKTQPPKTKKAQRVVPVDDSVINLLKRHKKVNAEEALKLGLGQVPWVFWTKKSAKPPRQAAIDAIFAGLVKRAGATPIRFHDLRHTHATLLLEKGVHPKIVSERLGHSTVQMTLDRYSHVLPHTQREAVKAIEDLGL